MICPPHHFVFEDNHGEFSQGSCKKCGATKQGRNWEADLPYTAKAAKAGKSGAAATKQKRFGQMPITRRREPDFVFSRGATGL